MSETASKKKRVRDLAGAQPPSPSPQGEVPSQPHNQARAHPVASDDSAWLMAHREPSATGSESLAGGSSFSSTNRRLLSEQLILGGGYSRTYSSRLSIAVESFKPFNEGERVSRLLRFDTRASGNWDVEVGVAYLPMLLHHPTKQLFHHITILFLTSPIQSHLQLPRKSVV